MMSFLTFKSPFVRHDTPHPKELKARHAKMHTKRTIDGHIIPHQEKKEVRIRPYKKVTVL